MISGGKEEKRKRRTDLLTVDVEVHGPAGSTPADRVAGHAAISSLVLLSHRTDEQCGVVLGEVVSVTGSECHVVPQPLEHNSRSILDRTAPGYVCLVLNDCRCGALLDDGRGHGD